MGWGWKKSTIDLPAVEDEEDWADLENEQLSWEVLSDVWAELKNVNVDVVNRKFIWSDGAQLSVSASIQRIHGKFSDYPLDMVEAHLIGWLEQEHIPEGYSQSQLDEYEERVGKWVDELQGIGADFGDKTPDS